MIKIIKEGINKIATCYNCGCVFSYEREDEKYDTEDGFGIPAQFVKVYINCPQCDREVTLKNGR